MNYSAAQNSFGICLECDIGVHKTLLLAIQYYKRAANHGHRDVGNSFGFCLEHSRGVQQNMEMAAEYNKFAACQDYSEAEFNHSRYLRLLRR
jgi:TPR repeat protein